MSLTDQLADYGFEATFTREGGCWEYVLVRIEDGIVSAVGRTAGDLGEAADEALEHARALKVKSY